MLELLSHVSAVEFTEGTVTVFLYLRVARRPEID